MVNARLLWGNGSVMVNGSVFLGTGWRYGKCEVTLGEWLVLW